MKQGANSAVRFTSYSSLQGVALGYIKPASGKLSSSVTFGLGAIAGLITVCEHSLDIPKGRMAYRTDTTMPLDNIKTRMQSTGAESRYRNSFDCLRVIVRDEGIPRLWGGTTPRLARLMVSH